MPRSWRCWLRLHRRCLQVRQVWEPDMADPGRYVTITCRCPCHAEEL